MNDQAFTPAGSTFLIGVAAVQVPNPGTTQQTAYRIRCLVSGYIAFSPEVVSGAAPTSLAAVAPVAGTPSLNTIGMLAGQVEVFCLPQEAWFLSSVAAGFEVTAGEGV